MTMNLKDIFRSGQEAERKYQQTKGRKIIPSQKKIQKLPWYNPLQIIKGAGVLYEMIRPKFQSISKSIAPIFLVMRKDSQRIKSVFKRKPELPKSPEELYQEYIRNNKTDSQVQEQLGDQEAEQDLLDERYVEELRSEIITESPEKPMLAQPEDEWIKSEDRV